MDAKNLISSIEMTAKYIPTPFNPNEKDWDKGGCLKWSITLERNGFKMIVPYRQGYGHIVNYPNRWNSSMTIYEAEMLERLCNGKAGKSGEVRYVRDGEKFIKIVPPTLEDVLYCLVSDSDCLDALNFEEWASELGFNPDSRKDFAIWEECLNQSRLFRRLVGNDTALELLREHFQDY